MPTIPGDLIDALVHVEPRYHTETLLYISKYMGHSSVTDTIYALRADLRLHGYMDRLLRQVGKSYYSGRGVNTSLVRYSKLCQRYGVEPDWTKYHAIITHLQTEGPVVALYP